MTRARFDYTEVMMTSHALLYRRDPVYHLVPDWHHGEGWKGEAEECNIYFDRPGTILPEEVVTPCGERALFRVDASNELSIGRNLRRMRSVGDHLALGHARKIGRPCRHCFPKENA